tara:strand:- start:85 stop:297 length:213 start_codon:yes stop_codon:yes gene_type:complete
MSDSKSLKEQITIVCQALGLHGCGSGRGGHVSMRAPGKTLFGLTLLIELLIPSLVVKYLYFLSNKMLVWL